MMGRQFTRIGLQRLDQRIAELERERLDTLRAAGAAAAGDSNAYHDNFAYEQGMREQEMLARRILDLRQVRAEAFAVDGPADTGAVQIGHVVALRFDQGEPIEYFLCGDGEAAFLEQGCSAHSPLGEALVGRAAGAVFALRAGRRARSVEIVAIRLPAPGDPVIAGFVDRGGEA